MKNLTNQLRTAGLVAAAVAVLVVLWFVTAPTPKTNSGLAIADNKQVESGLIKLANSQDASERVAAARFFAEQPPSSSTVIQALGKALSEDEDPRVRAAVASAIGKSRRKFAAENSGSLNEPQLLEIMHRAFASESDVAVRLEIVLAVGEFNHPEAAQLLSLASEDNNSSVREMAHWVKALREQRLLRSRSA